MTVNDCVIVWSRNNMLMKFLKCTMPLITLWNYVSFHIMILTDITYQLQMKLVWSYWEEKISKVITMISLFIFDHNTIRWKSRSWHGHVGTCWGGGGWHWDGRGGGGGGGGASSGGGAAKLVVVDGTGGACGVGVGGHGSGEWGKKGWWIKMFNISTKSGDVRVSMNLANHGFSWTLNCLPWHFHHHHLHLLDMSTTTYHHIDVSNHHQKWQQWQGLQTQMRLGPQVCFFIIFLITNYCLKRLHVWNGNKNRDATRDEEQQQQELWLHNDNRAWAPCKFLFIYNCTNIYLQVDYMYPPPPPPGPSTALFPPPWHVKPPPTPPWHNITTSTCHHQYHLDASNRRQNNNNKGSRRRSILSPRYFFSSFIYR